MAKIGEAFKQIIEFNTDVDKKYIDSEYKYITTIMIYTKTLNN